MNSGRAPFPGAWFSPGHHVWGCNRTYCLVPYASLPKLDRSLFRGEFQWLTESEPQFLGTMENERGKTTMNLDALMESVRQLGLTLPNDFVNFMRAPYLQDRIPSCTACFFDLSVRMKTRPGTDGHILRFMNDQQTVLLWYLYFDERGYNGVVASVPELLEDVTSEDVDDAFVPADVYFCAPT